MSAQASPREGLSPVRHRTVTVDGVDIFYREAGPIDAPAVLLLHGYPASSHSYRHLLPALADEYHLVAPDYPGFGYSGFPSARNFTYTFENYARIMERFVEAIGLETFALYLFDYGAPIGLRLALRDPRRVTAIIVQNGNAYEEGLTAWAEARAYWEEPTPENRARLTDWLTEEGVREEYLSGVPEEQVPLISPDTWTLDWSFMSRPGNVEVQFALFEDYRTNVAMFPRFQEFFRAHRPPALIIWGRHDVFFDVAEATAYRRDLPDAEVHVLDAGHFALETHGPEIVTLMRDFLRRVTDSGVRGN